MRFISQAVVSSILLCTVLLSGTTDAADKWIKDPIQISTFIHTVPAIGGDLGSRLEAAGLKVTTIDISEITKDDVTGDPEHWALGDVEIRIITEGQPITRDCPIFGSPTFIKRHGKYLPQDRTGVWLLTGRCVIPD